MGTIIQVQDINTKAEYSYEEGSDFFIDENHKLIHIVTSGYDENEHPNDMCIEIQGSTPDFTETYRVLYSLSFDDVRSLDMHRQALEMESDLDYMKSQGEKTFDCSGCDAEQGDVKVEPCYNCKDYCNYVHSVIPTNPVCPKCGAKEVNYNGPETKYACQSYDYDQRPNTFVQSEQCKLSSTPPVDGQQCPNWVNPKTWNSMQNVQKSINDFFANLSNPKTLNTKTGCLEPMKFEDFKNDIVKPDCEPLKETFGKYYGPLLMNEIHNKSREHVRIIIDYLWNIEMKNFSETFEVSIQSQDDLQQWIDWCENYIMTHDNLEIGEDPINHIFYHLMKLKKLYNL